MKQENPDMTLLPAKEQHGDAGEDAPIGEELSTPSEIATGSAELISTKKEGCTGMTGGASARRKLRDFSPQSRGDLGFSPCP